MSNGGLGRNHTFPAFQELESDEAAMVSIDRAVESPIALGSRDELGQLGLAPLVF